MYEKALNRTFRWTSYTAGAIILGLGVAVFFIPRGEPGLLSNVMGAGLLLVGANYATPFFSLRNAPLKPKWLLAAAIIHAVFGALFIARVQALFFAFGIFIGLWLVFVACAHVYAAFANRRNGVKKWWPCLVSSLLFVTFAAVSFGLSSGHPSVESFFASFATISSGLVIALEGRVVYEN
jgi:uncharacterized membrane protein HdeD (DUF308 family)